MLRIFLLGTFHVEQDGKPIEEVAWPRRKAKSLLKLLALRPGYRLHKEQVIELLWPDQELTSATSNLYRNLHLLRQALEPGHDRKADTSCIVFKEEVLRLNSPSGLWVDADAFQHLLNRARTQPDPLPLLEEALRLYKGDLLEEDLYEDWTLARREELQWLFHQAQLNIATLYRQRHNYPAAIAVLQQLIAREQSNESAYRELILTYTLTGQRAEALNQFQICRKVLDEELGLDPSPETSDLYQQILTGDIKAVQYLEEPSVAPQLARKITDRIDTEPEPEVYFSNLPAQLTPLVGREEEVLGAIALLRRKENRLLTLTGPGGVGKTRVALEVATRLLNEGGFPGGVCFVPLDTLRDHTLLPLAMAEATGIKEASGQPPLVLLKHYLRDREVLLVLDNFEQLEKAAGVLSELLRACPALKILVTSRSVLHLYGEIELSIQPLQLPLSRHKFFLEEVAQTPAIALFIQRAGATRPGFCLTAENAQAIVELCFRQDGLPLAIELVASRVKLFSPEVLLNQFSDCFQQLSGHLGDRPERQQTLQKALDWSYDLLDAKEQQLFARLGVFSHGGTLEAIETVCLDNSNYSGTTGPNLAPSLEAIELITNLVDKSLLNQQEAGDIARFDKAKSGKNLRFGMLEIIQEYAQNRLKERGEEKLLRERHLDFFLALVEEAEPKMHSEHLAGWLFRLELDHDNLRAILKFTLEEAGNNAGLIEKGARMAGALAWFWHYRGYWSEGSQWVEKALALAKIIPLPAAVKAKALYAGGWMHVGQGNLPKAKEYLLESLALYRQLGNKYCLTHAIDALAEIARQQGNFSEAGPLYESGLQLCGELHDRFCENYQLIGLGFVSYQQHDFQAALSFFQRSLTSCRELRDWYGAARALNGLGELARLQGEYAQANDFYQQSLKLYRESGWTGNIILLLHNLGQLELEQENFPVAETYFKESLSLAYELKSGRYIAWCLAGLACLFVGTGDLQRAAQLFNATGEFMIESHIELDQANRDTYDKARASVERQNYATTLNTSWQTPGKLNLDEAVSVALSQPISHNLALP